MIYMIRKHFLLPLLLDERIKLVARQDQKSEAEVIRELLESGLETKQEQQTVSVGQALRGFDKEVRYGLCHHRLPS